MRNPSKFTELCQAFHRDPQKGLDVIADELRRLGFVQPIRLGNCYKYAITIIVTPKLPRKVVISKNTGFLIKFGDNISIPEFESIVFCISMEGNTLQIVDSPYVFNDIESIASYIKLNVQQRVDEYINTLSLMTRELREALRSVHNRVCEVNTYTFTKGN